MKINRILNNNAIVVKDRDGEKIILGRGIAFQKKKNNSVDPSRIEKIFIMKDQSEHQQFEEILSTLPEVYIQVSEEIISNTEKELGVKINEHIHIVLTGQMNDLLRRIEEARSSMHQLALQYGFNAPLVLDLSQRLDGLLNTYHESVMKLRHVWVPKVANHED